MTILITGAGGFIGLNLIETLLADGRQVVALNNRPLPPAFATMKGLAVEIADVRDRAAIATVLTRHGIKKIIHAAAITLGPKSAIATATDAFDVNTVSTAILLEEGRKAGLTRFVYPSSSAVYGTAPFEDAPVTEDVNPMPTTLYGFTKLASERLVAEAGKSFGVSTARARITAVFGPHEHETGVRETMSPPYQLTRKAAAGEAVRLPDGGARDWTSSRDIARALAILATAETLPSDLYNLSLGETWHVGTLCQRLSKSHPGWTCEAGKDDASDSTIAFNDDLSRTRQPVSGAKFERDFGFRFMASAEACDDYVAWLAKQTH
ncbi:Nucleoside-diphosphate-sugar epimerase [Rhizobium sp. NFR07]|uniref:NAD-dependent epimerase/dehydratase family protein n=1 Tax=Rhizobium sp. NFR07 TaxID=1566262 RepID=UPI0008EA3222|nr:NAD-dependent epimerase/dehydratase family protein [Rhizobium sp. NFR07]SFB16199.1 Nucleoside-diphosphate-sugar epimerase [Rhizobium sp. NFR07]